jgi:hypothetical protein
MKLSIVQRSLLEKVAQDNGFDVFAENADAWLAFTSTQVPLRLWLGAVDDGWYVALSQLGVAEELTTLSAPTAVLPPAGAAAVRQADDLTQLHRVVRRAYQLSATLPDELLHEFERQTKALPRATEVERLVVQRVGQDIFREGLMRYWDGRCAVTGLTEPELLRASHIKPWARCDSDHQRLNVFNGLLLAVHLDAAFDRGFITFDDTGAMLISPRLSADNVARLGLTPASKLRRLENGHRAALAWHCREFFR